MTYATIAGALRAARKFRRDYGAPGQRFVCERESRGFIVCVMQRGHSGEFYIATIV